MDFIQTEKAPAAIGPYSQAVDINNMVFISGQIPLDPITGELVENDIKVQTAQSLENLKQIVFASNYQLQNIAKVTVYIKNMDDFTIINEIYAEFFGNHRPARAVVEVARLPKDVLIEIDAICVR